MRRKQAMKWLIISLTIFWFSIGLSVLLTPLWVWIAIGKEVTNNEKAFGLSFIGTFIALSTIRIKFKWK